MKCEYCNIEIHPLNLVYVEDKPYHYTCIELVNKEPNIEKAPILMQYLVLGGLIIFGLVANFLVFKLGMYLARLFIGR